jgi:hypothetical protein
MSVERNRLAVTACDGSVLGSKCSNVEVRSFGGGQRAATCVFQCLSRLLGNLHVQFSGERAAATAHSYPTLLEGGQ